MKDSARNPPRSAGLKEVARRAGLSYCSVAQILSGRRGYNPKTRARVEALAAELNCRPDPLARALAGGKTMTVAILTEGIGANIINALKLDVLERAVRRAGYISQIVAFDEPGHEQAILQNLLARRVDGLIVSLPIPYHQALFNDLRAVPMPSVYLDDDHPAGARHYVKIDRTSGIRQTARHLHELGHHSVWYFLNSRDLKKEFPPRAKRLFLYQRALRKHGIKMGYDTTLVANTGDDGHACVRRLLAANKKRPTALICGNDLAALGALAALHDAGIAVPEEISVLGFDDIEPARMVRPALTTVRQPVAAIGVAVDMLMELMKNPNSRAVQPVTLECELIVRDTTGPAGRCRKKHGSPQVRPPFK